MSEEQLLQEQILQEASAFNLREEVKRDGYVLFVSMEGNMSLSECYDVVFLEMTNQI